MTLLVRDPLENAGDTRDASSINPWVGKIPLEEEMTTHSSIFAWRIAWTEEPGGLQSMGSSGVGHNKRDTHTHTHTHTCIFHIYPRALLLVGIQEIVTIISNT